MSPVLADQCLSARVANSIQIASAGSTVCYVGATIGVGFLYHYFAPKASCGLNIAWITLTLIFAVVYTAISVSPWRSPSAGLLTSGVVYVYSTYLVWAALTSEPYGTCSAVSSTKALQVRPPQCQNRDCLGNQVCGVCSMFAQYSMLLSCPPASIRILACELCNMFRPCGPWMSGGRTFHSCARAVVKYCHNPVA